MKCPIKLSPATAKFIKDNDLVYFGKGLTSEPFLSLKQEFLCESLPVCADGNGRVGDYLRNTCGRIVSDHYFIRRSDAETHFPHCLPQRKPRPKLRYFIPAKKGHEWVMCYGTHSGAGMGDAYDYSGKRSCDLGNIEGVEGCVRDGNWAEVSKTVALARVKPPKTEVELTKEALTAANARISELEAKIASAQGALS